MENSYYLVTKPLQYFNCTNIEDTNNRFCLIVNNFDNARIICDQLKEKSKIWKDILFFQTYSEAFRWIANNKSKINKLFIDSDYGIYRYNMLAKLKNVSIYVYEEGIGNYRYLKNNFRHALLSTLYSIFLGNKNYLGGSKYINGIYLYDIEKHKKCFPGNSKKLFSFKNSFNDHLTLFEESDVFFPEEVKEGLSIFKGKKVMLYLSSYNISQDAVDILKNNGNSFIKLIKPHPHLKDFDSDDSNFDKIIPSSVMAELLIAHLCTICEKVVVIHENSTALLYISFENLAEIII